MKVNEYGKGTIHMRENGFQERKVTMRKINFGKKGIALMLSGIVALSGMTVISTQAANRTDKPFELKLDSQKTDSGDWRTKDNKSKVYVKVNYVKRSKNKVTGYVEGKKYSNSPAQNCSGGNYYSLNKKGQQWMTNYVHTGKLGYARIKGKVSAQAPNVIEGVWSPDSGK